MAAPVRFLEALPYFAGYEAERLGALAPLFEERSFGKGETIIWEGDPGEALYFVAAGAVKCFKTSEEGKEQILHIVLPYDSFGDISALDGQPSPVAAEAMTPVRAYALPRDRLERLMQEDRLFLENALGVLAQRTRHLLELVEDLSFRHVINRIARILVEYASPAEHGARPKLTQQDMPAMAGTAREVVARALRTLQNEGLIRMERNRLVIVDKEALQEMARALS